MRITTTRFGITNRNWIVDTNTGHYFLRRRHISFSPPSIDFELSIVEYLLRVGFPAPRLIRTRHGASRVQVVGSTWELYEFIYGESFRVDNLAQISGAGQLLARFHRAVAGITDLEKILSDSLRGSGDDKKMTVNKAVRVSFNAALPSALVTFARRFGMGNALTLEDRLNWRPFMPGVSLPVDRPRILVHGDFSPFNLVFRRDDAIALCDYDSSRFFYRSYDVACAILQFGLLSPNYRGEIDRQSYLDLTRVSELVNAYQAEFPLNTNELREVLMFIRVAFRLDLVDIILGDYSMADKVDWLTRAPRFNHWLNSSSKALTHVLEG